MGTNRNRRAKTTALISSVLILCGLIGLHDDWTMYVLIIPFGWIALGLLINFILNGKNTTKETDVISILSMLLLTNVMLIYFHRDTPFIIGRVLCCAGILCVMIGTLKDIEDENKRKIKEKEDEFEQLKNFVKRKTDEPIFINNTLIL